ncbi:Ig-like domain-containing protein, partial [Pseudogemmobacter bohemicus]|uniref:Ig-like domain-containing protein n=1 Tax=Pseudogemmobacter bohemicus TaxID=2250708 RepID=UPI000DD31365
MPVIALYTFEEPTTHLIRDEAPSHGEQNGGLTGNASVSGGNLVLDGQTGYVKFDPHMDFQLSTGTVGISFTPTSDPLTANQTVVSRDTAGDNEGSFRIEVTPDGAVVVTSESGSGETVYTTGPGFFSPGDSIDLTFSWDAGGAGGQLNVANTTTGSVSSQPTSPDVTLVMADYGQPWILGGGQETASDSLNPEVTEHFQGTVGQFWVSDSVDNHPVGEPPVANPDTAEVDEDGVVDIHVLANDTDPEGGTLTVTGASAGNGTVEIGDDGVLTYRPNPDFNGEDTITYTITDPDGLTSSTTVTVTVNPVNDDPVANDDSATTTTNTPVVVYPLTNDTDVDGDTLSLTGTPTSANGTVELLPDGGIRFTPNPGFTGTAEIGYEISDGNGGTDTATINITVTPNTTVPGNDGIIIGTDGDDDIGPGYVDADGDEVDAGDAIIPGDGPNDDRIYAGVGNDTVRAGEGNDSVYGGLGDDHLYGGPGDDLLSGDDGNDTIFGGIGNDTAYGGDGDDFIDTSNYVNPMPDIDYPGPLPISYPADTDPNNDRDLVYGGAGNDTILTGDDADTIFGGAGNDLVYAGFDADLVYGGEGDDTLVGGEGADTIIGGAGDDLIYGGLDGSLGEVLDIPDETDQRPDNNTDLLFGGDGNDTIYGRDDDDTLYGGTGNDLLYGGIDDDQLYGDDGDDTLYGDQGDD